MKIHVSLLLGVLLAVFQSATGDLMRVGGASPHLVMLFIAYLALFGRRNDALIAAALIGMLLDVVSLDFWGTGTISLLLLAHVLSTLTAAGWTGLPMARTLVLCGTLALALVCRGVMLWLLEGLVLPTEQEVLALVYTMIFAWPFFCVLDGRKHLFLVPPRKRYY